ncbi:mechanosensitive ion channel [Candidatus Bathyarchaeota archaeon]|nr:mechanosensitive ion channel [Candidatus Bathyarchaeota archaeon]
MAIVIVYVLYRFIAGQIIRLRDQRKLEANIALTMKRISQWVAGLAIIAIVFSFFGIEVGLIAGLLTLAGGTIIGFAAMNTLGNAIAGIIVMTSRPFKIGDRIYFNGKFADVIAVDLIYTRMRTLDNVLISVPNQELLKTEIDDYGKSRIVRRSCSITAGYDLEASHVEKALLEAAGTVNGVLKDPKPYVWITDFKDYAAEYTLYVFINDIKRLPEIDAELKRAVLESCKKHSISIETPLLLKQVSS